MLLIRQTTIMTKNLLGVNEKNKPCVRVCVRVYVKKKGYVDIIKSSQTTINIYITNIVKKNKQYDNEH